MKYKVKDYSRALAQILSGGKLTADDEKKVIAELLKILAKQGDLKKAKEIIKAAKILLAKKENRSSIVFETARNLTGRQKEILLKALGQKEDMEEKISPDVVAGIRIIANGEKQLDQTISRKINSLF